MSGRCPKNLTFFTRYGIRPIILTRNIFDVMVSLHEHIRDRSRQSHSYHVDESYDALDDKERMDGVIRFEAPWFFQFYVGWHNAVRRGDVTPCGSPMKSSSRTGPAHCGASSTFSAWT